MTYVSLSVGMSLHLPTLVLEYVRRLRINERASQPATLVILVCHNLVPSTEMGARETQKSHAASRNVNRINPRKKKATKSDLHKYRTPSPGPRAAGFKPFFNFPLNSSSGSGLRCSLTTIIAEPNQSSETLINLTFLARPKSKVPAEKRTVISNKYRRSASRS